MATNLQNETPCVNTSSKLFLTLLTAATIYRRIGGMEKLHAWLELTGTTHQELADLVGVSRMAVHNWLTGRSYPSGIYVRRLHNVTHIALDYLVPQDLCETSEK